MLSGRLKVGSVAGLVSLTLAGCAGPIAGALTIVSAASTVATGKGLSEQALSAATGKDCNVLGTVMNPDRELCEEPGSEATKGEFKGLFGGEEEEKQPVAKPVLVRLNGRPVYTVSPVARAGDIANAETVRALPAAKKPGARDRRARDAAQPKPVLVRIKGKLIYTMAPVARPKDIRASPPPPPAP